MTADDARPLLGRHDAVPRRRWRWLLPLVVALGVVALLGAMIVRVRQREDSSPKHAVASYLDAVQHGKTERAYAQLCVGFHKAVSYASFAQRSQAEKIADGGVIASHISRIEPRPDGEQVVTYIVRRSQGDTVFDAALVREQGKWRLCGFRPRSDDNAGTSVPPGLLDTGGTTTTR